MELFHGISEDRLKELMDSAWTLVSNEERARGELYEADKQRERRDEIFAELMANEYAGKRK